MSDCDEILHDDDDDDEEFCSESERCHIRLIMERIDKNRTSELAS